MINPLVRRRQPNGEWGPLEPLFPGKVTLDPNVEILLTAVAGQQMQIEELKAEVKALKGGAE